MAIATGARFGVYEIVGPIGAGGMGEVYRATDVELKRDVAIKVLPEAFANDADRLMRFRREAETLAALNHPNIAQIYGLEKSSAGTLIVMELVAGPTLADRIAEGPLQPDEALGIARQIAAALEAAHERQIVHRDLKPANIKLRPDGAVKVLDFGIAKTIEARTTSGGRTPTVMTPAVTETGVILGTAAYMAPEQARGRPVDQRADIWAFGCLLFEMLTGQPAFAGDDVMVTLARVLDRETDLRSVPGTVSPAVRQTIKLCLEKNPRKRISDIRDVMLALEGAFATNHVAAGGDTRALSLRRRLIGHAAALLAGGAAVAIAAAVLWPASEAPSVSRYRLSPPTDAVLGNLVGLEIGMSPDGRHVAFVADAGGSERVSLYVHELDDLAPRALPGATAAFVNQSVNPFFAADSSWIGYWAEGEGLMRVPTAGGPPIHIAEIEGTFRSATVLPDGTVIYATQPGGLYRVSSAGSAVPEPIPIQVEDGAILYGPKSLPGERRLLVSFQLGAGNWQVGVLDPETGAFDVVMRDARAGHYLDDGYLVFVRGTTLMAAAFDAESLVTGEAVALFDGIRAPENGAADFSLSRDGSLAYIEDDGSSGTGTSVVWVDRENRAVERLSLQGQVAALSPRVTPDGQRVALTHGLQFGGRAEIWVHQLGRPGGIPIVQGGQSGIPVWSPDGTSIAFISDMTGSPEVFVVPADGSVRDPEPLRADQLEAIPKVWTSEGDIIAIAPEPDGDSFNIVSFRADGSGDVRNIVATPDEEFDPALSPNGRWLAYASDRSGEAEIWIRAYPDGVPMRVSAGGGQEPVWSHDGDELFYLRGSTIIAIEVDTASAQFGFEAEQELFNVVFSIGQNPITSSYDVTADGLFVLAGAGTDIGSRPPQVVVVENFDEEVRRLVPTE